MSGFRTFSVQGVGGGCQVVISRLLRGFLASIFGMILLYSPREGSIQTGRA